MKYSTLLLALLFSVSQHAAAAVLNASGTGSTRSEACGDAKRSAKSRAMSLTGYLGTIREYGSCDCSRNKNVEEGSIGAWECNVDIYYEKKSVS